MPVPEHPLFTGPLLFETFQMIYQDLFGDPEPPEQGPNFPPSDIGMDSAIPLPPPEWTIPPEPKDWAEQNRRVNDLLMGREDTHG